MENGILIALILVILLVVGINGILFLMLRKQKPNQHVQLWQKAAKRAQDPWGEEDKQLEELSDLVTRIKSKTDKD